MYWSGAGSNGTVVAMLNPSNTSMSMQATFAEVAELMNGAAYEVTEVWTGESMGCKNASVEADVEADDTVVFLFGEECSSGDSATRA